MQSKSAARGRLTPGGVAVIKKSTNTKLQRVVENREPPTRLVGM